MPERTLPFSGRVAAESVARLAIGIYNRSVKESAACVPEWIHGPAGEMTLTMPYRAQAASYFAGEAMVPFARVRCTRRYMRVDLATIADEASQLAADLWEMGEESSEVVAYTWEGEGWLFEDCERDDPGSIAMWHCEVKADPPAGDQPEGSE